MLEILKKSDRVSPSTYTRIYDRIFEYYTRAYTSIPNKHVDALNYEHIVVNCIAAAGNYTVD